MTFKSSLIISLFASAGADSFSRSLPFRGLQEEQCKTVDTVPDFDLENYASRPWYIHQQAEIDYAPLEQNFCVKAEYTIRDSNTFWGYSVDVLNYAQDVDGAEFGGPLCAFQEEENLSKLNVAPCFLPKLFAGPYWVIAYDEDQGYALVSGGQPTIPSGDGCKTGDGVNGSGLWIFSRSPTRDESLISTVREIALDKGFDLSVLNDVQQDGCAYTSEEEDEVLLEYGESCSQDSQCIAPQICSREECSSGAVGESCWYEDDCLSDNTCEGFFSPTCKSKKDNGSYCDEHTDCKSGRCGWTWSGPKCK